MKLNQERIQYELEKQELSASDLALKMGRARTYGYYLIWPGINPTLKLITEIAEALGINAKDLIE